MPEHLTTRLTRRRFLQLAGASSAGLLAYAGEFERHHLEITHRIITLARLSPALDGLRIAQLSDFHYEQYTEPYFIREVVAQVNRQAPDLVLMTGDFISEGPQSDWRDAEMSFPCAETLAGIHCKQRWCVLGNHDATVGPEIVTNALESHGHRVLANAHVPFERGGARLWLAGVKDVGVSAPDLNLAAPCGLQSAHEPVILMAHEPDYADRVIQHGGVDLMLSGHTHGGQIRLPMIGALYLPKLGRKYVEGLFSLGNDLQLYVNRGIGSVGVPFRFYCRPELTMITLRSEKTA